MSGIVTMEDAERWHMREAAHFNGGKEWFGYEHVCVEQPRLRRMDKYFRKDRSVQSTWKVDGQPVEGIKAAVEALNTPPSFTDDERQALREMSLSWSDLRDALPYELLRSLAAKGAITMDRGLSRPTDIGRSAR